MMTCVYPALLVLPLLLYLNPGVYGTCTIPSHRPPSVVAPCSSCVGRCGEFSEAKRAGNTRRLCSCDARCIAYSDCCYDFPETCPKHHSEGNQTFGLKRAHGSTCSEWVMGSGDETVVRRFLTVSTCPNGTTCNWSPDLMETHLSIPVTSYYRSAISSSGAGVHYINYECAKCNYAHYFADYNEPWEIWLNCNETSHANRTNQQRDLQALLQLGCRLKSFSLNPIGSSADYPRPCEIAKSSCIGNCTGISTLEKDCAQGVYQSYVFGTDGVLYKNPYCAYCQSTWDYDNTPMLSCELPPPTTTSAMTTRSTTTKSTTQKSWPPHIGHPNLAVRVWVTRLPHYAQGSRVFLRGSFQARPLATVRFTTTTTAPPPIARFQAFSLRVLVNFDNRQAAPLRTAVQLNPCSPEEVWMPQETACRKILCPEGFTRIQKTCFLSRISLNWTTALTFMEAIDADGSIKYIEQNERRLLEDFDGELGAILYNFTVGDNQTKAERIATTLTNSSSIGMMLDAAEGMYYLNVSFFIELKFHVRTRPFNITFFFESKKAVLTEILDTILLGQLGAVGIVVERIDKADSGSLVFFGSDRLARDCKLVSYNESEYNRDANGTITIIATNRTFTSDMYEAAVVGDGAVCICLNVIRSKVKWITLPSAASGTLGLVTLVLISISILCLVIRLCLQGFIPYYQTFAGWLQFHLCLSLCLAFTSLIASGTATLLANSYPVCLAVAACMYWMFLTAFAWMLSIAFNTWKAFRPSSAFRHARDQSGVRRYALCAWLLPLALVGLVIGIDFSNIDPRFRPHLGVGICWFNQQYTLLIYFGVPIACCMLLSTVFYSLTVNSLRRCHAASDRLTAKRNPSKIRIYASLFIVMGTCWCFCFAAAFIHLEPPFESALWYIFILLNASQGIFIFIFFVCKRHILMKLKRKLGFTPHIREKGKVQFHITDSSVNVDTATSSTSI